MSLWTLETGVELARQVERALLGIGYHCALGGSVLHKSQSEKDCDLFIYPRQTRYKKTDEIIKEALLGAYVLFERDTKHEYDDKKVWVCVNQCGGQRIDIFVVN